MTLVTLDLCDLCNSRSDTMFPGLLCDLTSVALYLCDLRDLELCGIRYPVSVTLCKPGQLEPCDLRDPDLCEFGDFRLRDLGEC